MAVTTDGLGGRAIRGASVTLAGQVARVVLLLASTVVLSRLISPEDFGLLTIVMSVVALGELLRDFGLSTAAARSTTIQQGQKSNLFWINTGLGAVLTVVALFVAEPISAAFGQPALNELISVLSPVFILSGAAAQFRAEINRNLRFGTLTICDTLPVLFGLVSAILFASFVEANYWALAIQQLCIAGTGLLLSLLFAKWVPGLPNRSPIREFTSFGIGLFGTQFVAYFTKNTDNVALGYVWGPAVTGVYGRAYQILMLPMNQILAPLTRVAVPILTRVASDQVKFTNYIYSAQRASALSLALLYGTLIGLADPLIVVVFGDNWTSMTPIFQALAVGGVFRGMNQITFWVFLSKGATTAQFKFFLWSQPLIVIFMLCGLPWGALGVAIGHSAGYALNWLLSILWCSRVVNINLRPMLGSGAALLVVFMIPAVVMGQISTMISVNHWIQLAVGLSAVFVYLSVAYATSAYIRRVVDTLLSPIIRIVKRRRK